MSEAIAIQGNMIGRSDNAGPQGKGYDESGVSFTLTSTDVHGVCVKENVMCLMDQGGGVMNVEYNKTGTLRRETHGHEPVIHHKTIVRRLTPTECERLQGFPDGWTNILAKTPDSPRYKALGNSMAVPVMKWIGQRIGNQQPVVYDQEAIRNALFVAPIREDEGGQLNLFS